MPNSEVVGYSFHVDRKTGNDGALFSYRVAGNGVFVEAARSNMRVCLQISAHLMRGLDYMPETTQFDFPQVPAVIVKRMVDLSRSSCVRAVTPIEALFHLTLNHAAQWQLEVPEQIATGSSVRPCDDGPDSSYHRALIEVHSHHEMSAFFSRQDDADEQGFRIYAVLGRIFSSPEIRVRVGCYGYFRHVPADEIFELPEGLNDLYGYEDHEDEEK